MGDEVVLIVFEDRTGICQWRGGSCRQPCLVWGHCVIQRATVSPCTVTMSPRGGERHNVTLSGNNVILCGSSIIR